MQPNKQSERQTQDYAAGFYEDIRYKLPAARAYYDWFFKKFFSFYRPQGLILDNGCGNGIVGEYLPGEKMIGLDISEEMIKYARIRLAEAHVGDSQAMPFADGTFDTVVNLSLLHHVADPERAVREIARVLKPGGVALFEEVVSTGLSALPRVLLNRFSGHFSEDHKNFKKSDLLGLIGKYLKIERSQHYGYLAYALLGFPDIINFQKYLPAKSFTVPLLLGMDNLIEKISYLNTQSWNIIIVAKKL